jgi:hypothetical protein
MSTSQTPATQQEILSADGVLLGYVVPAADARHLLTFDSDFGFIGVADTLRSARVLIDDYIGQAAGARVVPLRQHLRQVA